MEKKLKYIDNHLLESIKHIVLNVRKNVYQKVLYGIQKCPDTVWTHFVVSYL